MMLSIGWYKNKWLNIENIYISGIDRGLKFGDGIFETILIKQNKPILLREHIKRLQKSSSILNIDLIINKLYLEEIINEGIKKLCLTNNEFGSIRINYSRGKNQDRSISIKKNFGNNSLDNLWLEFYKIDPNLSPISAYISQSEKRNQYSRISKCKTFSYNQAIMGLIEANQKSFDDCLMLNTSNELCCGSNFNILLKRNNKWKTPRKESGCLEGIMVGKALELKIVEEDLILPKFEDEDILIAINSLSCKQINRVNDLEFVSNFDPNFFWELLYN